MGANMSNQVIPDSGKGYLPTVFLSLMVATYLGIVALVAYLVSVPAVMGPFAATTALLAALPKSPFSQPKTLFVGHAICVVLGLLFGLLLGHFTWVVVVAATTAITLMVATKTLHAPAVAHTVIIIATTQSYHYALAVLAVVVLFTGVSCLASLDLFQVKRNGARFLSGQ